MNTEYQLKIIQAFINGSTIERYSRDVNKVKERGYKISNLAIMLEGKKPKLDEHIDKIKASLSRILKVKKENIGIAATSGEELTEFGKGLGNRYIPKRSIPFNVSESMGILSSTGKRPARP